MSAHSLRPLSVRTLAQATPSRPAHIGDVPDMSRATALRQLLQAHRDAQQAPVPRVALWLRGIWQGRA